MPSDLQKNLYKLKKPLFIMECHNIRNMLPLDSSALPQARASLCGHCMSSISSVPALANDISCYCPVHMASLLLKVHSRGG